MKNFKSMVVSVLATMSGVAVGLVAMLLGLLMMSGCLSERVGRAPEAAMHVETGTSSDSEPDAYMAPDTDNAADNDEGAAEGTVDGNEPVVPWDYAVYPANVGPIQVGHSGDTFLISSFRVYAFRAIRVDAFEMVADKIHREIWVEVNGQRVESTRDWGTVPQRGLDRLAKGVDIAESGDATFSVFGTVTPDWNYTDDHHTRMTPVWAYLPSGELARVDPEHDAIERTYRTIAR